MHSKKHIAIVALGSLGDTAMIVPVVAALRAANEGLKISAVVRTGNIPLMATVADVNIMKLDEVTVGTMLTAWWHCLRTGVDGVADLSPNRRSGIICMMARMVGIRASRVRVDRKQIGELTRRVKKPIHQLTPIAELARETIARLGLGFELPDEMKRPRRAIPAEISLLAGEKHGDWIGIAPLARYKGKIYPMAQMVEVIEGLAKHYERIFILGGGDVERLFGEGMEQRFGNVRSVINRLDLTQELALLANLDAVLTMDSASMHLAAMMGVPVVAMWGATHPYVGFAGFAVRAEWAVQLPLGCRPCSSYGNKRCIWGDYRCMTRIEPAKVVAAVERAVADGKRVIIRRRRIKN